MSTGIPATGSLGTIGSIMAQRNRTMGNLLGVENYDHKSFLITSGLDADATLQIYENAIEGDEFGDGDGIKGNLLSWNSYFNDQHGEDYNNYIFQGQSAPYSGTFANIDFSNGTYNLINEDDLFELFFTKGEGSEKPYDVVEVGQGTINFAEYYMTNGTGADLNPVIFSSTGSVGKIGGATYTFQGINLNSEESLGTMQHLLTSARYWLSEEQYENLAELVDNQSQFMTLYKEYLVENLDPGYSA